MLNQIDIAALSEPRQLELHKLRSHPLDSTRCHKDSYRITPLGTIQPDIIRTLLSLHPLYVCKVPRKEIYSVVFGRRLFELAAFGLPPSELVPVRNIKIKPSDDVLNELLYLATVVFTSINTLSLNHAEHYAHIQSDPDLAMKTWAITSKACFAKALGISPSLLSTKPRKPAKGSSA